MKKKRWKELGIVLATVCALTIPNGYLSVSAATTSSKTNTDVTVSQESKSMVLLSDKYNKNLRAYADSTKVSTVLSGDLLTAVLEAYNAEKPSDTRTEENFTYKDLKRITGVLDLSAYTIDTIPKDAFVSCQFSEVKFPTSLKSIEGNAFTNCTNLETINLPDSMTTLGESAFNGCISLTTLNNDNVLPSSLTSAGNNVFANNTALKSITLKLTNNQAALKNATGLFSGCTALESITIGDGVAYLPVACFKNAGSATEAKGITLKFGKDLTEVMTNAFEGAKFKEATSLDFSSCTKLAGIESNAFGSAENLKAVILPASTSNSGGVVFGDRVFSKTTLDTMYAAGDEKDNIVYLPDYISSVGQGCFYGNNVMTSVSISPNVTLLDDYLFDYCTSLAAVEQRTNADNSCEVTEIGDCAFRGTAITNTDFLLAMDKLTTIGYQHIADDDYSMQAGVYSGGILPKQSQEMENGITSLPLGGVSDDALTVSVDKDTKQKKYSDKMVGSEVFSDCYKLVTVSIPSSVTTIGSRAFYQYPRIITNSKGDTIADNSKQKPSIQTITWNSGVGEHIIYSGAFHGNTALTSVMLPYTKGDTLKIGSYAFAWDQALNCIKTSTGDENVLPASITSLAKGVFYHCEALPSIVIQDIEGKDESPELGAYLFEHCTKLSIATLPAHIKEIPAHCFYNDPLTEYNIGFNNSGEVSKISKIGNLAFLGNKFTLVDLSKYTGLTEIGAGAFAYWDNVNENGEECQYSKVFVAITDDLDLFGKIEKVILPDELATSENEKGILYLNTAPFYGQTSMTTLTTNAALQKYDAVTEGVFYVPDYIVIGTARAVFGATGVSKTVWQVDIDSDANKENQWTTIPMLLYANCMSVTKTKDVLPVGNYVEKIGKGAFYNAQNLIVADLSNYTNLSEIGTGNLSAGEENCKGAFALCFKLEEVTLPISNAEKFILGEQTFYKKCNEILDADTVSEIDKQNYDDSLTTVNLGNISEMQDRAFAGCRVLETIELPNTLNAVPTNAFLSCVSLQHVNFGEIKSIGSYAFKDCKQLSFEDVEDESHTIICQLPDTLETIGEYSFENAGCAREDGMGTALFGSKISTIEGSAFEGSGLNKVDFSEAKELTVIGSRAFYHTQLETFEMSGTKVTTIPSYMLGGCLSLQSITLGEEIETVQGNALSGCPQLVTFTFAAATLVAQDVFNNECRIDNESYVTSDKIAIQIQAPDKVSLPAGREEVKLPFYVFSKGNSELKNIMIDTEDSVEDETVKEYIKIHAKLSQGYFWHKYESGSKYEIEKNSDYYEALTEARTTVYNSNAVDVITLDTLKEGNFQLHVSANMKFLINNVAKLFDSTTTFHIESKELHYSVGLYKELTDEEEFKDAYDETVNIQSKWSDKGAMLLWYQMEGSEEELATVDSYDIVVKTDNPQIVYPGQYAFSTLESDGELVTRATRTDISGAVSAIKSLSYFYLIPTGVGTAHITIFPKGHETWAQTYTVNVNADIKAIQLAVPESYKEGAVAGDAFNIFSSYTNVFDEVVNADNIDRYSVASNAEIEYSVNLPEYASVDDSGKVTILKANNSDVSVKITATVHNANESDWIVQDIDVLIKGDPTATPDNPTNPSDPTNPTNPTEPTTTETPTTQAPTTEAPTTEKPTEVSTGQVITDAASNITVAVTVVAGNGNSGEVTVQKVNDSKLTKIVIPNTVTVNGVSYKVTTISANAFANCTSAKSVSIGTNVTTIESGAFKNCKKLTKVVIPKNVTTIAANAFYGCKSLKLITVKTTKLKSVGSNAFKGIHKKAKIKVPKKKLKAYKKLLSNKGQKKSVKITK